MTRPSRRQLESELEDLRQSTPSVEFDQPDLSPAEKDELDRAIQQMIDTPTRVTPR